MSSAALYLGFFVCLFLTFDLSLSLELADSQVGWLASPRYSFPPPPPSSSQEAPDPPHPA